jgi:hypothetical protein
MKPASTKVDVPTPTRSETPMKIHMRGNPLTFAMLVTTASLLVIGCSGATSEETFDSSEDNLIGSGKIRTTEAGAAAGLKISGKVTLTAGEKSSSIFVEARGLAADVALYPAHVHNGTCADGGGTHYLLDPAAAAGEANEVWPSLTNVNGSGTGIANVPKLLRPDAKSVVIHDPATKAKIACADIKLDFTAGKFAVTAAGKEAKVDAKGWAGFMRRGKKTHVWAHITEGLTP